MFVSIRAEIVSQLHDGDNMVVLGGVVEWRGGGGGEGMGGG